MRRVFFFIVLLYASEALAQGARIRKTAVEVIGGQIVVSFELKNGFNKRIMRDIHDGLQKDFYYYMVLQKKYKKWFDEEIVSRTLRYSVQYDTVKKIYTVDEEGGRRIFDQLEAMQAFVSTVDRMPVAAHALLEPNHRYIVRVKAQMKASHIPLALDRFLFFIPFLDLDTPWAKSGSLYAP